MPRSVPPVVARLPELATLHEGQSRLQRSVQIARGRGCTAWLSVVLAMACGAKHEAPVDDVAALRTMLASETLPPRPNAIALAQTVAARAVSEGETARGAELSELSAKMLLRVFRQYGRDQDGKEAVQLLVSASKSARAEDRCRLARDAALLGGEVAADAETTYLEIYRASRRLGDSCAEMPVWRARLNAFRPSVEALRVVDDTLASEGVAPPKDTAMVPAASATAATQHVSITRIDSWVGPDNARVVVVLSGPTSYRVGDQAFPDGHVATYVDLAETQAVAALEPTRHAGLVSEVSHTVSSGGTRVTVALDGKGYRKVFHLTEPYRIVFDLARNPAKTSAPRMVSRVVLDPGHGGTDPGAQSETGLKEKDVTLDLAHRVAPVLAKLGIQVMLTRDDDHYVSLEERTARANATGADLFVSIHCNAAENKSRHGIETYVLDTQTSDMAGRVAARENATSTHANAELGSILANMRLADQSTRSVHLATLLQRSVLASVRANYADAHDGGVHQAGFYVLVGARMPGVLFEASYLSNTNEGQKLGSSAYRDELADGIVNAIKAYRDGH